MIPRKRTYEKENPYKDAQKIYIICEGEDREKNYFEFFNGLSSNLELIVIPPEKSQSDPEKLMELSKRLFLSDEKQYVLDEMGEDLVYFVIDTDKWNIQGKTQKLVEFCQVQNRNCNYNLFNIVQSNPCFEIWLYYHIYEDKPDIEEEQKYPSMKDFVDKKISGGFNTNIHSIYIEDAICHSQRNYSQDKNGYPSLFCTMMHILAERIVYYSGEKLKRKLRTLK